MSRQVHMKPIDGLRFLSFLIVFLHHERAFFSANGWRWLGEDCWLAKHGYWGVQVFFVISGFLIGRILLDLSEQQQAPLVSRLAIFYARRTLRIVPLYYLLLVALVVLRRMGPQAGLGQWSFHPVWHFLYLTNLKMFLVHSMPRQEIHLWTLCVEEHFYLLAPLLVVVCPRRLVIAGCVAAWVSGALLHLLADRDSYELVWFLSPSQFDALSAGVAAAMVDRQGSFLGVTKPLLIRAGKLSAVGFVVLQIQQYHPFYGGSVLYAALASWLCAVAVAALVVSLAGNGSGVFARILGSGPLARLGEVSYALYLVHPYVIFHPALAAWVRRCSSDPRSCWLHLTLALSATICIAMLSWHLYERPIRTLKRFFPYPDKDPRRDEATTVTGAGTG